MALAGHLGLSVAELKRLGENDRSATGYLPRAEFEAVANLFFAHPNERSWLEARRRRTAPDRGRSRGGAHRLGGLRRHRRHRTRRCRDAAAVSPTRRSHRETARPAAQQRQQLLRLRRRHTPGAARLEGDRRLSLVHPVFSRVRHSTHFRVLPLNSAPCSSGRTRAGCPSDRSARRSGSRPEGGRSGPYSPSTPPGAG